MEEQLVSKKSMGNAVCAAAALLLIGSAGNAFGSSLFTMTWTGPDGSGSAILTATADGTDEWTVTSLTGTQNSLAISVLTPDVYGDNDNDIYQPPGYSYLVDEAGLGFTDGVHDYNIFDYQPSLIPPIYSECTSLHESSCTLGQASSAPYLSSLSITPYTGTVPEPTSVGLVGIMVLGAAALTRRKHRVS
jgi:hypothetical protein